MNTILMKSTLATAIALSITACSPSGGGSFAGIGGSGYVSSGSVSGFGSVFVNGVEFETDSSTFDVDGISGTQDDLAIGMIVQVSGSINDDGITGTANNISFDDQLQGPVTGLTAPDADGLTRSFMVLGTKVIIDSSSTTFDVSGKNNLPVNTVFDFDNIANDNNVEISGFFDSNGNLKATRIELKDINFDSNSIVEIKGTISGLNGTSFNIGNLAVDASTATLDDLPNGLENGLFVEAKGTLDAGLTNLIATKVEAEDDSVDDTSEFELEGIITDYVDDSNFKISGISVNASNATREPTSLSLANDAHVEAEGAIVNGILVADEIESEGGDIKVHAMVSSVDLATNTFKIKPVSNQPEITVTVNTNTQLEDDVSEIEPYTLTNLFNTPGFVEVRGYDDGNGGITAVEVDVKETNDVVVQGYATSATGSASAGGTVTILGITFSFDNGSTTDFEKDSDIEGQPDEDLTITEINNLIAAINVTPQLVKVGDDEVNNGTGDGIADEIEPESP